MNRLHPDALYYHIALESIERAKKAREDKAHAIQLLRSDREAYLATSKGGLPPVDNASFSQQMAVVTAMTFTAMCLEAYINECYATLLATLFDEVERFPHESKWMMLPRLLGENETFDKGASPYQTFAELVATRNTRLVHFKQPSESKTHQKRQAFTDLIEDIALAEKFIDCVSTMVKRLNELTRGKAPVPDYLSGAKYIASVSSTASMPFEVL
jgi:hypothetical protein